MKKHFMLLLEPDQLEIISRAADRWGIPRTAWMRSTLLEAARAVVQKEVPAISPLLSRGMQQVQSALLQALAASAEELPLSVLAVSVPRRMVELVGFAEPRLSPEDPRAAALQSCRSCIRRGWAVESRKGMYRITEEGRAALAEHLGRYDYARTEAGA